MQKCKHFRAALTSLLVLYATDRESFRLAVVGQLRNTKDEAQTHGVREVACLPLLRRTPEVHISAFIGKAPIHVPVASRQRSKGISISAIAAIEPATCRF